MRLIMIGFGTVGQNLARIIDLRKNELLNHFGLNPRIVAIVDTGGAAIDPTGLDIKNALATKQTKGSVAEDPEHGRHSLDAMQVIEGVDAEVVLEMTPTKISDGEPGLSHIRAALRNRKHVVTTNKAPLAMAMPSLIEMASYNEVQLKFSGTVGGGTPILSFASKCLNGNTIIALTGILNGTTNYILTRMAESDSSMDTALKEAQASGYAEDDPSYDLDGVDTACKLVILANSVMGRQCSIGDVEIKGIREVNREDTGEAKKNSCRLKLVGTIADEIRVEPQRIPRTSPLCVDGTLNAVSFKTELMSDITIVGKGAGGVETATAVLRDIVDVRGILAK